MRNIELAGSRKYEKANSDEISDPNIIDSSKRMSDKDGIIN